MNLGEFAIEYEKVLDEYSKKHPNKNCDEVLEGRELIKRIKNDPTKHFKEMSKAQERKAKKGFKILTK